MVTLLGCLQVAKQNQSTEVSKSRLISVLWSALSSDRLRFGTTSPSMPCTRGMLLAESKWRQNVRHVQLHLPCIHSHLDSSVLTHLQWSSVNISSLTDSNPPPSVSTFLSPLLLLVFSLSVFLSPSILPSTFLHLFFFLSLPPSLRCPPQV